jgi:hypothetical protein
MYEAYGVAVKRTDGTTPKFGKMVGTVVPGTLVFESIKDAKDKAKALNKEYHCSFWRVYRLLVDIVEEVK